MTKALLTLPLRNKRDSMIARQRTRQLAGLLGYDTQEQARIAAGVFAIAWQILSLRSPVQLCFCLDNDMLQVQARTRRLLPDHAVPETRSVVCLEKPLPARTKINDEDLNWAIEKLDQITPAHMYEEVYRLNQELLAALHALDASQTQVGTMNGEKPSAA